MTAPAMIDIAVQRARLVRMAIIDVVCVIVAAGAITADLGFHLNWLIWVFAGAVVTGFAAQIWLVAGLVGRRGSV